MRRDRSRLLFFTDDILISCQFGEEMTGNPPKYKRFRKGFGHIKSIVNIPDLIGMQRESYQRFLQIGIRPDDRVDTGLQAVFNSVFPIKDFANSASLEFVSYHFGDVKHSVSECINRGMTHEISVRIKVRLVVYDVDKPRVCRIYGISRNRKFISGPSP